MNSKANVLVIHVTAPIRCANHPVEIVLDPEQVRCLGLNPVVRPFDVEKDRFLPPVPSEIWPRGNGNAELVFLAPGILEATQIYRFVVVPGQAREAETGLVALETMNAYQGQETYRISTPNATYYYHKAGAGFASIVDNDGNDWLSFSLREGSRGIYRGIPNIAHPENYFHPGGAGCVTKPAHIGPLRVVLESQSADGSWACRWDIFAGFARLTMLKVAHPYWFLYEGTPAGNLEEDRDFCVRSDGVKRRLDETWEEVLPDPKWLYFSKPGHGRALFVANHGSDNIIDSFWPMEKNMTVFGFGRNGLCKHIKTVPHQFTIGICESVEFERCAPIINAAITQLQTKLEWRSSVVVEQ